MQSPVLHKHPPRPDLDYKYMTWERFLRLRRWAEGVAKETGYPVYLVGSALEKVRPRDIDVSIIMPDEDYVARFGEWAPGMDAPAPREWVEFSLLHEFNGEKAIRWATRLDLKACAASWFPERPKLLLAAPGK